MKIELSVLRTDVFEEVYNWTQQAKLAIEQAKDLQHPINSSVLQSDEFIPSFMS